ncbi:hypothetical protein DVA86_29315 [Streptomyces armeniacus]|uniref:Uncharacterized protein n=1 Tax=Streptomyces armeniacus TaxID=83291 RepID=A0A345XWS2_9ACTN|nr:hypothetical protein [Streptomyces armeniacus]AXK36088.1 hypothetical protein DVA86_29315 [Streptomyces armeniacus]
MKTTMIMRNIANPQRTTLAHLEDADDLTGLSAESAAHTDDDTEAQLPPQTANPRRTVLVDAPGA